uniref:NADH-ubiquinone oxidoreductase 75 kDa subunit, mitochondrial n=1 Tax=Strongyloides stercoralis TaxID=6248 RepID=A0AAF5CQ86_STRER
MTTLKRHPSSGYDELSKEKKVRKLEKSDEDKLNVESLQEDNLPHDSTIDIGGNFFNETTSEKFGNRNEVFKNMVEENFESESEEREIFLFENFPDESINKRGGFDLGKDNYFRNDKDFMNIGNYSRSTNIIINKEGMSEDEVKVNNTNQENFFDIITTVNNSNKLLDEEKIVERRGTSNNKNITMEKYKKLVPYGLYIYDVEYDDIKAETSIDGTVKITLINSIGTNIMSEIIEKMPGNPSDDWEATQERMMNAHHLMNKFDGRKDRINKDILIAILIYGSFFTGYAVEANVSKMLSNGGRLTSRLLKASVLTRGPPTNHTSTVSQSTTPAKAPEKIEVFINDKPVMVDPGMTILQACAVADIDVPRFCYHDRLSIAGNCRMCLVEVEKSIKPVASCAMPVMKGMKIKTHSDFAKKAREGVMEFLLVNHPLDCPICDQGGECDLQDQSMAFGSDKGRLQNDYDGKRAVEDKDIGPLVKTSMNRCIQCTRCVRFANEIAGVADFGTTGRGNEMQIGTYVEKLFASELSGNVIDLCPVGALTSRPYSFMARPWETRKTESIDVMDSLGSNIVITHRTGEIFRIIPRMNDDVNEEWISDKTRFAVDGLKRQRLTQPMLKKNGNLVPATWEEVLFVIANKLKETPSDKVAAIAGGMNDAESMIALKDLFNKLNSENIYTEDYFPTSSGGTDIRANYIMNDKIAGIEEADALLLVGTNPRYEAPVLNARIRKTYLATPIEIGLIGSEVDLTYDYTYLGSNASTLDNITSTEFGKKLASAKSPMIIVSSEALKGEDGAKLLGNLQTLASKLSGSSGKAVINVLAKTAAQTAAFDIGLKPFNTLGNVKDLKLVYLLGADETGIDKSKLDKDCFVIYQGHHGDSGAENADAILPGSAYTEKDGIYVNTEGRTQVGFPALTSPGDGRVDWKIIRAISEVAGVKLPYDTLAEIRGRLIQIAPHFGKNNVVESTGFLKQALALADTGKINKDLSVKQVKLEDFYMTNTVSRASPTMAECIKAAQKFTSHPHKDSFQEHAGVAN